MSTLRSELALVFSDAQVHSSEACQRPRYLTGPASAKWGREAPPSPLFSLHTAPTVAHTTTDEPSVVLTPHSLATAPSQSSEMCNNPPWDSPAVGWIPALDRTSIRTEDMGLAAVACPTGKVQDDSSWSMALSSGPRTRAAQKAWLGTRPGLPLWQYQALDVGGSASDLPHSAPTSLSACARHHAADDHTVHRRAL